MNPLGDLADQWPGLNELLDEALALPAERRGAWLQALPAEHAPLKEALARLLEVRAGIETGDFLGTLPKLDPPPATSADAGAPQPGDIVGPWRLVRELGEGGMGSVWLAERADGQLKRPVALKLPRLAWARGLAERMARERDILATLEHPNIARLYDAGVDALGRPWMALEFVDGQPLDVHACERSLSLRQRVQLLLQAASAVAFAHGRLVIHRDLKPSNILVSALGEVKLLDFGIAKLLEGERTEATALTQWAGRALTPDYASPEQIRGEPLGTASDVYSLAVVAYELLAGARPYRLKRGSAAEFEEAIISLDAPRASTVATDPANARALRGDLDAILAQALRKSPADRYPTVQALAEDWQRWLDGLPVRAMPDRLGYRLRRTLRRHWFPASAVAVTTAAVLTGTVVAVGQAHQARAAQARAEQEATTAKAVQGFLESVFLENRGDQADPGLRRQATARDLLDRGAERIARDLQDAPAARLRLLRVLGGMYEDLNEFDRMRELYALRVEQARALPGPDRSRETMLALADLAHAEAISGREADARIRLDEAETLLARHPDADARLRLLVRRASVHRADDLDRAARAAAEALALARTLPPSHDLILAAYLVAEGDVYDGGEPQRGVDLLGEIIPLVERRPELGASLLATLHSLRADGLAQLRRTDAAEAAYRRALEVERQRGTTGVTPIYLTLRLGLFLHDQDRWKESAEVLQPAWDWARGQDTGFETTVPMAGAAYGRTLLALGRVEEAGSVLQRAAAQTRSLQDAPDIVPRVLLLQARASIALGRWLEADRLVAEAESIIATRRTGHEAHVRPVRRELRLARGEGALALEEWLAERRGAGLPEVPGAADDLRALVTSAQLHLAAGQFQHASRQAQAAIRAGSAALSAAQAWTPPDAATAHQVLGRARLAAGQPAEAVEPLQEAVKRWAQLTDPDVGLELAAALRDLARAQQLVRTGDAGRAASEQAEAILARHPVLGPQHRGRVPGIASR